MDELDRNELAWDSVQPRIRGPLLACAWLRAVPDDSGPHTAGVAHASYAGPLGGPPFVLAVTRHEAVALDVRWPEPTVSILTRWPLARIQSERTGQDEMRLSVPGKINIKVRPEHPGPRAAQLLDLLAPLEGQPLNQDEPVWRTVLSFVLAPLIGFSVAFFRSLRDQNSIGYSIGLGILAAAILLAVMAGFFLIERPRR